MDRGQVVSGKSSAKQTLSNDVIKDVNAVKNGNVYELDPKLWYFSDGSTSTTIKQFDELNQNNKNVKYKGLVTIFQSLLSLYYNSKYK